MTILVRRAYPNGAVTWEVGVPLLLGVVTGIVEKDGLNRHRPLALPSHNNLSFPLLLTLILISLS